MFPNGATLIEIFTKKTEEWHSYFPDKSDAVSPDNFIGKTANLHYCNFYQWIREGTVRSMKCDESEIVRLKKEIDASNSERSTLIEELDAYFVSELRINRTDDWSNLYINSQTLGEIIDKLSVLCLKHFFMKLKLEKAPSRFKKNYAQSIERIEELLRYVATCYDRFSRHLSEGKGYMPHGQFKIYNSLYTE